MESIVITWRELLVVLAIILAVYIAELLLQVRSGRRLRTPRLLRALRLRRGDASLRYAIEELEDRIAALEAHFDDQTVVEESIPTVSKSPEKPSMSVPAPTASPYMRAIQMAKQGLDADAVAAVCGISRSEAELIIAMHGRRAA